MSSGMTPERAKQIRRDLEGTEAPGPPRYFDKDGRPIPSWRWVVLFENESYRRVAETHIWPNILISTIWLGLDHGFGCRSLFFETMVFTSHEGWEETERYSSLPASKFGHQCQVEIWKMKRWWMLLHVYLLDPVLVTPSRILGKLFGRRL